MTGAGSWSSSMSMAMVMVLGLGLGMVATVFAFTPTTTFLHPSGQMLVSRGSSSFSHQFSLVEPAPLILNYHNGPVIAGVNDTLNLFVIYYGNFQPKQRTTLRYFFRSFYKPLRSSPVSRPTVQKWWEITHLYTDLYNNSVASTITYAGEQFVGYPLGKSLKQTDIQSLVLSSFNGFGGGSALSMYLVLTSADVYVENFCSICGTHFYTFPSAETKLQMIPYAWVGNSATQCPATCSWPYSNTDGSPSKTYISPNNDVGIDGMIIVIANILAGTATDPYGNAFFQGDAGAPLESAGACQGEYGPGSYPGYPGALQKDSTTNASFNVFGAASHKFLVPWIWHPTLLACAGQV